MFLKEPQQVTIWHVLQYHEWSTLIAMAVHSQQTDNIGMAELLHQIYLFQKLCHILFISAGESLDSHWKSSLVPCYILKTKQLKDILSSCQHLRIPLVHCHFVGIKPHAYYGLAVA